ncbi:carnitine O-acetyltransferase YAT2 NDAI_0J00460 [Naumovozyma dairenensis CBS 421]|uniref:Choline/carnitine acyltransferase domain-containing protein n=1 Tax=Naumovozyma dairenensis (strain ATCC 10597 / BCRC 20456 / CBS 421 / NBRC 0211 / NRRL Y-12639) TaxID=1071378 RepID=G0WGL0_NAUDC|nr:hypothetical protein NDAI_0J00460 [Naumovozyma dairenensis CBS 421]CCD26938.1 hypothetical protein NDAI_0J00460 [Naumovozyma dairenensis CBS 421]
MTSSTSETPTPHTFQYENSLPNLPLPELDATLESLKKSLEPLYYADGYYKHPLDPIQIEQLTSSLNAFVSSDAASKLQSKLKSYYENNDCYLDKLHLDINNHTSTTEINDDILPRNPFLVLADDAIPDISQADRSAVLVHSALRFISALKQNVLSPDFNSRNGNPLSMAPYNNLFGTTRCPVFQQGEVENFDLNKPYTASDLEEEEEEEEDDDDDDKESSSDDNDAKPSLSKSSNSTTETEGEEDENDIFSRHGITIERDTESKHILIISKGQYYIVTVLDHENKNIYSTKQLTKLFNHILFDSHESYSFKKSTALGSLTSHSFRNWKYARKRLQKRYPQELALIDSALFVLVLDESVAVKDEDDNKRLFYGTSIINERGHQVGSCVSRWYDKLQLVVTADSKAAIIWDSFTCDGSVVLRFISETYTESVLRLAREVNAGDPQFSLWSALKSSEVAMEASKFDPINIVQKIDWSFSNILNTHVHLSETKLADLISKYDIVHSSIPIGRRSAQRLGIKPDSMVQIALQVAHYALYGKMVFGFEPISTRAFKNSRSTFVNIQNQDLLELCQMFISTSTDNQTKLEKFIQTCQKHNENIKLAKKGHTFEKHFNALKYLYKFHNHFGIEFTEEDKKLANDVFENPLIAPFSQPELIIANCGNAATITFGITPAVPQGFGVGYIIKDDQCDLTITSQFRQGKRLIYMLRYVLNEFKSYWRLIRETSRNKNGIKISPSVDRLYKLDNALNGTPLSSHTPVNKRSSRNLPNTAFFDLDPHMGGGGGGNGSNSGSRSVSSTPSLSNIASRLAEITKANDPNGTHSSEALSVPTVKEKLNIGHQIFQIHPHHSLDDSSEGEFSSSTPSISRSPSVASSRPESRKQNVINSKFDIDFDRGRVGRKVATFE